MSARQRRKSADESSKPRAKLKYALYVRESTKGQLEGRSYNSLESQADYLREWVEREHGEVFRLYSDVESGTKLKRDGLTDLFVDAQAGKFDVAVAYDMDRWARNIEIHVLMRQLARSTGVRFLSATQAFSSDAAGALDAEGKLMELQIAGFAEFYSDVIARKVKIKRRLMAQEGRWLGGPAPFGFETIDKSLVPHAKESEIVRLIFSLYLEHPSVAAIRLRLKAMGIKNRSGEDWSTTSLEQMLRCRVYVGDIQNAGEFYRGRHDSIVEPAIFDAARRCC